MADLNDLLVTINPIDKKTLLLQEFKMVEPRRRLNFEELTAFLDQKCRAGHYDRSVAREMFKDCMGADSQASMEDFIEKYIDMRNTIVIETKKELLRRDELIEEYEALLDGAAGHTSLLVRVQESMLERVYGDRPLCYVTVKTDRRVKTTRTLSDKHARYDEDFEVQLEAGEKLAFVLVDNNIKAGEIYYDYRALKTGERKKEKPFLINGGSPTASWISFEVKAIRSGEGAGRLDELSSALD
jgi:hypothetical protein